MRSLVATLVLFVTSSAVAGTDYYCSVNPEFPGKVLVFKEGSIEDSVLVKSKIRRSMTELENFRITTDDDDLDHDELACLVDLSRDKITLKNAVDSETYEVLPTKMTYRDCGGDEIVHVHRARAGSMYKMRVSNSAGEIVYSNLGRIKTFWCGSSSTD